MIGAVRVRWVFLTSTVAPPTFTTWSYESIGANTKHLHFHVKSTVKKSFESSQKYINLLVHDCQGWKLVRGRWVCRKGQVFRKVCLRL